MDGTNKPRLLTLKEASALIKGLTQYRIKMLCKAGELKHYRFGNKFVIPEKALLQYFGEESVN